MQHNEIKNRIRERWNTQTGISTKNSFYTLLDKAYDETDRPDWEELGAGFNEAERKQHYSDLRGIELRSVKISTKPFYRLSFNYASLIDCKFEADLQAPDFSYASLTECGFTGKHVLAPLFLGADLNNCKFESSELVTPQLKYSTFTKCEFKGCSISNVFAMNTTLTHSIFSDTQIDLTRRFDEEDINMQNTFLDLSYCSFYNTKIMLRGGWDMVKFNGCYMQNMSLNGKDNIFSDAFKNAGFREANIYGSDLSGNDFLAADFANAILDGADFSNCNLRGANFRGASLKNTKFDAADLEGAIFD